MLDLDLRLLAIFEEIYKVKSVSQAAQNLGIAQPTVSAALGKLRKRFDDPLFARTSTGMEPTPRATELWAPLTQALKTLEDALRYQAVFDPTRSDRCFRLCMTDISQIVLLPGLVNHYKDIAPRMRVEVIPIDANTPKLLESADADLAVGFMPRLEAAFFQQALFEQTYACVVRADHPRITRTLTLRSFNEEAHVEVAASGTGHGIVGGASRGAIRRRIALKVPNFLGMAAIVESTDLIGTVPQRLAEIMARTANIRIFKPPVAFPSYTVKQHWHERFHHDPRNRWLRASVAALFMEARGAHARGRS
jgi:DNA-binding transcriptional LysR family regulator